MVNVTCQSCGRKMLMNFKYVEEGLADGSLVEGDVRTRDVPTLDGGMMERYEHVVFDICKVCIAKDAPKSGDAEVQREKRIQQKIHLLREMRPDLTEEQRRVEAVRDAFDPVDEPDKAFRAYLLDGGERDEAVDAAVRTFFTTMEAIP